jgi:hypothetical protein
MARLCSQDLPDRVCERRWCGSAWGAANRSGSASRWQSLVSAKRVRGADRAARKFMHHLNPH